MSKEIARGNTPRLYKWENEGKIVFYIFLMFEDFANLKDEWMRVSLWECSYRSVLWRQSQIFFVIFQVLIFLVAATPRPELEYCQTPIKWLSTLKWLEHEPVRSPTFNYWLNGELFHRRLCASELCLQCSFVKCCISCQCSLANSTGLNFRFFSKRH